jgi:cytochrome c peroxidase
MEVRSTAARALGLGLGLLALAGVGGRHIPNLFAFPNPTGEARTLAPGALDTSNPFFQSLGTNGRACGTCHLPGDGWSLTPATARQLFDATGGTHPLFRLNDGANAPTLADDTPAARRTAYSLLLERGVIRVGMPVPPSADFVLDAVDDPHHYASAAELSLFRRPLPATNLRFLGSVMWDGRHSHAGQPAHFNLGEQANGATVGHAQGTPLTPEQREAIVAFETGLISAQSRDDAAGELHAAGGLGGPHALADQPFYPGINTSRDAGGFSRRAFTLFPDWAQATGRWGEARRAVARGQAIFNERPFTPGTSTCTSCHNAPNVGTSSLGFFFDLGLSAESRRSPRLPLYTLRCIRGGRAIPAGQQVKTTDPGLALVTGRCDDIGRFKVPALRGLAARAPYFHNGAAATLEDVVTFYDQRFSLALSPAERADLVAFLRAL